LQPNSTKVSESQCIAFNLLSKQFEFVKQKSQNEKKQSDYGEDGMMDTEEMLGLRGDTDPDDSDGGGDNGDLNVS
jgi:hypothetical protein